MDERARLLERFHVALVASIERAEPRYLREPFTIGEVYEELIPYRTHRDLIGVAMNGDYEDGLMRLLAGEGDYLRIEPPEVAQVLAEELDRKPPDTARFKEFRDASVRLNPDKLGREPPRAPSAGVAKLFDEESKAPPRSTGPRNGWDLDVRARGAEEEPEPRARPRTRAQADPGDRVQSANEFWEEREDEPEADSAREPDDSGSAKTDRLEAENRRLKILLAERVLEVEELRERLNRGTGASRDKP